MEDEGGGTHSSLFYRNGGEIDEVARELVGGRSVSGRNSPKRAEGGGEGGTCYKLPIIECPLVVFRNDRWRLFEFGLGSVGFDWVGRNSKGPRLVYTYPSNRMFLDYFPLLEQQRNTGLVEFYFWDTPYIKKLERIQIRVRFD